MSNAQFFFFITITSALVALYAWAMIPAPYPSPVGKLLLRDDLLRLTGQ